MLAAIIAATACDRTTSIGAAGALRDGATSEVAQSGDAQPADANATQIGAGLCTMSGGTIGTSACCGNVVAFPDECAVGACGCPPTTSHSVPVCHCPVGCFLSGLGCVGAQGACTEGMDLSCNQDTTLTSARGRCVQGGRCVCAAGAQLSTVGKCQ